jgi:hypothetical protein
MTLEEVELKGEKRRRSLDGEKEWRRSRVGKTLEGSEIKGWRGMKS